MRDWNGFLGGMVLGLVLGGVMAILYAPERGERTRKRLARKGEDWWEEASDQAEDLVDTARDKLGR
ncbi:MAG: YtxH domain-containing protein [Gemmatimonadota bacterium]|nr:YtxH domain-containing protein [Gemmatimonadota bacterium]